MLGWKRNQEGSCLADLSPPISVSLGSETHNNIEQSAPIAPVIFASPHSGRIYPKAFVNMSLLSKDELRRNEDIWIDELFSPALSYGAALIKANFPRSYVDVNRAADEFLPPIETKDLYTGDLQMPSYLSARAKIGLGVIPLIIAENIPIYSKAPKLSDIDARLKALYFPYHTALSNLAKATMLAHGKCLLIDCHSMPGFAPMGARRSDIILGDCHGLSCHPDTISRVESVFKRYGYSVTRNAPYAGGYVTSHYHKAIEGVETLQIEVNRDLYVNPVTLKRKSGYGPLANNLNVIIGEIISGTQSNAHLAAQ